MLLTRPDGLNNPHSTPHRTSPFKFAAPIDAVNSNGSNYAFPLTSLQAAQDASDRGELLSFMSNRAEGRSHVKNLVQIDRAPQKEETMLVFQSLVIIWCVINNCPTRLLKKFTMYNFVNIAKKGNGQYVRALTGGNK